MRTWETRLAAFVVCAAILWRWFARYEVTGASMAPLLVPGDRLLVRRTRRVAPGDVVVVRDPRRSGRMMVKRVSSVTGLGPGRRVTVLGDAPGASTDSRVFGPVPRYLVRGKVVYRYAPSARAGLTRMGPAGRAR